MRLGFTLLMIFVFNCFAPMAQQDSLIYRPAAVGLIVGTFGAGVNIELKINEKKNRFYSSTFIRVFGGVGSIGMGEYYYFGGAWEIIYGEQNHHFEMSYGASISYDSRGNQLWPLPVVNWGYRFKKPNSKFYFRTGLGSPEVLYIGIGLGIGSNKPSVPKDWEDYEW